MGVAVGVEVGVAVGVGINVGVGVSVGSGVAVAVGAGVKVGVGLGSSVNAGAAVGAGMDVGVGLGMGVNAGAGVGPGATVTAATPTVAGALGNGGVGLGSEVQPPSGSKLNVTNASMKPALILPQNRRSPGSLIRHTCPYCPWVGVGKKGTIFSASEARFRDCTQT